MGLRSDHQAGRSWDKRGQTPVVPGTGKRFRCNVISSLTPRGALRFRVFEGRFNSQLFIDFMRRLLGSTSQKVFLIVDRHPVHLSKAVRAWLEQHTEQIRLFLLPTYSPPHYPQVQKTQQNQLYQPNIILLIYRYFFEMWVMG